MYRPKIWAIEAQALEGLRALKPHLQIKDAEAFAKMRGAVDINELTQQTAATAVVSIRGPLYAQVSRFESIVYGAVGSFQLAGLMKRLAVEPGIKDVILEIDSPGGDVRGMLELAAAVRTLRAAKTVTAIAHPTAASAAYWLAAQATRIVATPSGQVGSIGVLVECTDTSAQDEARGIKRTIIADPEGKALGRLELDEAALAEIKGLVARWSDVLHEEIALGRGIPVATVRANFGNGRMLEAEDAKAAGMIDEIAEFDSLTAPTGGVDTSAEAEAASAAKALRALAQTIK